MINIYDSKETDFSHNGLAVLDKCIRAEIHEELNGLYELELEYPITNNRKWEYLIEDNIIQAPTMFGLQLFRIYHKTKSLKSIKVNARHIFYDLLDNLVEEIDIRGLSGQDALKKAMDNLAYTTNFKYFSNISWRNNIYLDDEKGDIENKNPVEVLFLLISIYCGELRRDRFNFLWLESIGQDNGIVISYGKNIKGIEEDLNRDSVITRIKPIGQDGLTLDEKYIDSPYINNYPHPKIKVIEFSDCNDYESLRRAAKEHYKKSKCDLPVLNYKIDFIELSKTEEYKNYSCLETLNLGDIVTVKHKILKINVKQKVIKYKYDCLRNRYSGIELGNFKENLNKSFEETDNDINQLDDDIKNVDKKIKSTKNELITKLEKTNTDIKAVVERVNENKAEIRVAEKRITTNVEDKIHECNTKITQTEKNITSSVEDKIDDCNTKIEETAKNIELLVDGGEVDGNALVSAINMSNKKISAKSLNIDLDGYVTFSNLERGQTIIDGSCIKAGTIDANEIGTRISKISNWVEFAGSVGTNFISTRIDSANAGKLFIYSSKGIILDCSESKIKTGNGNTVATREWVDERLEKFKEVLEFLNKK